MYRDEMASIFAHGYQNGYENKGPVLHGKNVVVCRGCVDAVKDQNSLNNIYAVVFGVLLIIAIIIAAAYESAR